jgi:glycosyltransferase involved in cell wall biosynthesis
MAQVRRHLGVEVRVGVSWSLADRQGQGSVARLLADLEAMVRSRHTLRSLEVARTRRLEANVKEAWRGLLGGCERVIVPCSRAVEAFHMRRTLRSRTPILYLPLGELPRGAHFLRAVVHLLQPGDVVACSCRADLSIYRKLLASSPARLAFLPFGVDTAEFHPPSTNERRRARQHYGLEPGAVLFTYLGRLTSQKNIHGLIRALAPVLRAHPDCHLALAGPEEDERFFEFRTGPFELGPFLAEAARGRPSIRKQVHPLGRLSRAESVALLHASDVFVNLTLHHDENFGFGQVEAMATGLPVLGSDWGGLKDTLVHQETALLARTWVASGCEWVDLYQAGEHAEALAGSVRLRRRLGVAGRVRAHQHYSMAMWQARLLRLLEHTNRATRVKPLRFGNLGQQLVARFGTGAPRWSSVPNPVYFRVQDYSLHDRLIGAYASGFARAVEEDDVVFLAPLAVRLGEQTEWIDPLWPRQTRLNGTQLLLLRRLLRAGRRERSAFLPVSKLVADENRARDMRALNALVLLGLLGYSPRPKVP